MHTSGKCDVYSLIPYFYIEKLGFAGVYLIMSPPFRVGRHIVFPCASVCPSLRHKSCLLYNLKTVKDFSMKLGTLVNLDETMCHAQEP